MITLEYHFRSVLKSSEKGNIQLVAGDDSRLYVRRYREISQELFRRLQSVSCPNIERLTERSGDENGAYFISEYIEGTPASDRTFTEKEAVRALLELCAAIKALHKAGVIHRDIKPANIICGADGHIRLIDFDFARLENTFRSRDTELLGTAGFAPPEQYGFMQTDRRSDIYSFGVTMREILGDSADKPKFRRIINRCTQFDPERRYSGINAVRRAVKRAARPNCVPFAAMGVIIAAGILLFQRKGSPPAPPGIVRLSETTETEVTMESVNTAEAETPTSDPTEELTATTEPTQEQPMETAELPTTEPSREQTAETAELPTTEPSHGQTAETAELPTTEPTQEQTMETADLFTSEQAEPIPEITDPTGEETTESTTEYIPATTDIPEPGRTPNILSDSINPNKMPFETVRDEDGLYTDVFDYVFYDDPAVCGEWRLIGLLEPDTDFEAITAGELTFFGSLEDYLWQYLTVSTDGSYVLRDPDRQIIERSQWTNGYCITFDGDRSFVRRMFGLTVDGVEYLMLEQKPTGNYRWEIPHRFLVYSRNVLSQE